MAGVPVDFAGGPTVDPTANVLQLVSAGNKRTDDILELAVRRLDDLRVSENLLTTEKIGRINDKVDITIGFIEKIQDLVTAHETQLKIAEAGRIDAIRAVDVGAVGVAAERQVAAAGVLADQLAKSAEQTRALVQDQAVTVATAQRQLIEPMMARLAALERTQAEGIGRSGVADPQAAAMMGELRAMREAMALGAGAKQGMTDTRVEGRDQTRLVLAIVAGFIGFFGLVLTAAGFAFALTR
jgi:hypothetical protein